MIFNDAEPMVNIGQAINVLNVVEAVYKSDNEGQWVKVKK